MSVVHQAIEQLDIYFILYHYSLIFRALSGKSYQILYHQFCDIWQTWLPRAGLVLRFLAL